MFSNEQCEGREKHAEKTLDLPECLRGEPFCGDDYLEITAAMQSGLGDTWEHKLHPKENRPIEKELKVNVTSTICMDLQDSMINLQA